jgi:hypothetical protein
MRRAQGGALVSAVAVGFAIPSVVAVGTTAAHASAVASPSPVLVSREQQVGPIAVGGGYLVWERGGRQAPVASVLIQRDLRTGRTKRLATGVAPVYGVASTSRWIVYARQVGLYTRLLAVSHDAGRRMTLSPWVITPLDVRGERVAWAEERGPTQRILVRNMASGVTWQAASYPKCVRGRCYRIDAVTLSERGVAFDRGAVGSQPSLVVRRAFGAARAETAAIPGDPQPDLARSASGAYYYAFARGWFRWDFGIRRPRFTGLGPAAPAVLDDERGRLLQLQRTGCRARATLRIAPHWVVSLNVPARIAGSLSDSGPLCQDLTGFAWTGRTLLLAWTIQPKAFQESHTDFGLVSVVTETRI